MTYQTLLLSSALTLSVFTLAACSPPSSAPSAPALEADLYITATGIYSGTREKVNLKDIAVENGLIICASNAQSCAKHVGENTQALDFDGYVYPGFTDSHAHLLGIGQREMTLNLEGTSSITDLQGRVQSYVDEQSDDQPIIGRGWIETHWPENRFPTREDLDTISSDRVIILQRADGHASVVNSKALELAGINAQTEIPFGGDILRGRNDAPTGMLIDTAQDLVASLIPAQTAERNREAYIKAGQVYSAAGWTGLHNMSVSPREVSVMQTLSEGGQMPLRVFNSLDYDAAAPEVLSANKNDTNARITTRSIKLYIDGALGSRGAALLEPYSDDPKNSGLILLKKNEAMEIFKMSLREGIQVNTHAIGDRGNRLVLDWYKEAFTAVPETERVIKDPRWRVEHAQILNLDDLDRFKALGVIPSMQPSHAIGDLHFAPSRIGVERLKGGYAWQSLLDSGVIIVGGSDAPVERGDPRIEFYAAVARKDQNGFSGEGWYPEQAVSRLNALKMFTSWPAYASFREDSLGTIEVGKIADFTIFSDDIMTIDEADILTVEPVATIIDGKITGE